MKKIRNPFALHANTRRAEIFKDKRSKRIQNKEIKELEEQTEEKNDEESSNIYDSDNESE